MEPSRKTPSEVSLVAEPAGSGTQALDRAVQLTSMVVEADAPRRFVFRWVHPEDQPATPENSFLVTFELEPAGGGTLLRLTEAGFREVGWEAATLEAYYRDHSAGWDQHLPSLAAYVARVARA